MTDLRKVVGGTPVPSGDGLTRAEFFNRMIGALSETIEDVVGLEDAESFVGVVGRRIGNSDLAEFPNPDFVDPQAVAQHLVDFKSKIGGAFSVEKIEGDCITFVNSRCPFAKEAEGRTSLCQMTTNVFGRVAANATGYSRVNVQQSLARGDHQCRVTVRLAKPTGDQDDGQEFYG